jgi:transposase
MWTDATREFHARAGLAKPKRFDRRRMGAAGAGFPAGIACRATTPTANTAHCRGNPVPFAQRSTVLNVATVLPAGLDRQALVLPVARQRVIADAEPFAANGHARDPGSRGLARCRRHRRQSLKTTESGGPRGYDDGKKIEGRKRHMLTDTEGNLVHAVIHTADIQDHDGAPLLLAEIVDRFPRLRHLFADGGYAGDKLRKTMCHIGRWLVEIIKRSDVAKGFEVLPRCWVVERTLAWLTRNCRLAKDFEQAIASATSWMFVASAQLFTR